MPAHNIGIRGYIGEIVFEEYLRNEYSDYEIVKEIAPYGINNRGGAYLDFGVTKQNKVYRIFEIKTQDYVMNKNSKINKSLLYTWNQKPNTFHLATKKEVVYHAAEDFEAELVLLVPPNRDFLEKLGKANRKRIHLFSEYISAERIDANKIREQFKSDMRKEIFTLLNPEKGKPQFRQFFDFINY